MRKFSMGLSAAVVAGMTTVAMAQSGIWFDVRNNGAGQSITAPIAPFTVGQGDFPNDGPAGGGRGNGQVLRLNPVVSNNFHLRGAYPNFDADANKSTGKLWMYADVADDLSGVGDVISSIGLDIAIPLPPAGTSHYEVASTAWSWVSGGPVTWSGTSNGSAQGTGGRQGVNDFRAVKVPVSGAPAMYDTTGGLVPNPGGAPYQIARADVVAASRGTGCTFAAGHATASNYTVNMAVDSLLITRVYNGAGDAQEDVSFGYGSPAGSPDTAVNGNTVGAGSAGYRDAVIQVRMQGDANGNGSVTGIDLGAFATASGLGAGISQSQRYLFDNNNNGTVTGIDLGGFSDASSAPCP